MTRAIRALAVRLQATVPWRVFQRFSQADGNIYAPMIAYTAIFSMFPIMLAVLTLISIPLRDPLVAGDVERTFAALLPPGVAGSVLEVLKGTTQEAGLFGVVSFVGLLWGGSALFGALEAGFDRIYEAPKRSFLRQRLMAVAMVFVFATFLVLAIATSSLAQVVAEFWPALDMDAAWVGMAASVASWVLSLTFSLLLFTVIYLVVPNVRLGLRNVWPGALFGTVIFFLMLQVFPLYVRYVAGFNQYGALFGFFFVLLTWFYLLAVVLLLGAAINAVLRPLRPVGL